MKRNAIQPDANMPSPLFPASQGLGLAGLTSGGAAVAKDTTAHATPTVNDDALTSLDNKLNSFLEDLNRDQVRRATALVSYSLYKFGVVGLSSRVDSS